MFNGESAERHSLATAYHRAQNRQAWSKLVGTATSTTGQATWWWWWCTKFNSNISYNRWKRSNIWSRRSTDDVIGINFLFRFLSLWHLSVVVLYRRTKFCANIFIQYGDNYELFTKFNLPTDRHLGFVAGSRKTTHEGLILCKNFFMIVFVMFRL